MKTVYLLTAFLLFIGAAHTIHASQIKQDEWNFKVYLDDDEIGFHQFIVKTSDTERTIYTTARFDVKFLFFTAYSYQHSNIEMWDKQCLLNINSKTDDNGKLFKVNGKQSEKNFIIETNQLQTVTDKCIKTFAYWDPSFLNSNMLLNSQTGELINIQVENLGFDDIQVNNKTVTANNYRITGDKLQIDLWYSNENRWLSLQSTTEDGYMIRYEIQ